MSRSALHEIRVLDLADLSGAYCGKLLADMGADVIKVEPLGGDPLRAIGPFYQANVDSNRSLPFWHYHTNKRSVSLDLASRTDRVRFDQLIDSAEVLVATGTPSDLRRRGLDYPTLSAHHPRLVVAVLSPFGQTGPYAEWRSCDTVAQAVGGMLFLNGHPHEPPLRGFGLQAYHSAAVQAAIGIVLALLSRRRTGYGQLVDVSLQESVAATVEHASAIFHQSRQIEVRRGTLHWSRSFRVGKCRDGHVVLSSLGDWTSLIEWVKADGKANHLGYPAWAKEQYRREECDQLFDALDDWAKDYTVASLVEGAQLRRLPYAAVAPVASLPSHPQLQSRQFFPTVDHDDVPGPVIYPGAPYRFSATPWQLRHRAPQTGEHTAEVLDECTRDRTVRRLVHSSEGSDGPADQRSLAGVRVLDFTWVVAGPVTTRILADHGADVLKVERRDAASDVARRTGLTGNLNRGKRSIAINLTDRRGIALVRDLVRQSDVVIDNFSSRVMANWGLDYPSLRQLKPDLIVVNMSGFGSSGPQKDHVSFAPTLHALAGYTWHMRHPGGQPAGWGLSFADMASGYYAALAVLLALWHRQRTGVGQLIELSQFEAVTTLIGPALLEILNGGTVPNWSGNRSPEGPAAPHGVYRCLDASGAGSTRDRWCAIAVFGEDEWARFVRAIGTPVWTSAPRFTGLRQRLDHQDELDVLVESWTSRYPAEVVMQRLQEAGVAAGVVANAEDLCLRDPHLQARRHWTTVFGPDGEAIVLDGVTARLSSTPGFIDAPGPLLGEHTAEILRERLGVDESTIEQLRADGVAG